jgi:hypothetical protein
VRARRKAAIASGRQAAAAAGGPSSAAAPGRARDPTRKLQKQVQQPRFELMRAGAARAAPPSAKEAAARSVAANAVLARGAVARDAVVATPAAPPARELAAVHAGGAAPTTDEQAGGAAACAFEVGTGAVASFGADQPRTSPTVPKAPEELVVDGQRRRALPLPMSLMLQKHRERGRTIWKESGWRPEEDNSGQDPRSAAIRRAAAEVAKLTRKAEQVMSKKDVVSQTAAANAQRVWSERMTGCFPDGGWAAKPGGHPHDLPAMPAVGRVTCESEG